MFALHNDAPSVPSDLQEIDSLITTFGIAVKVELQILIEQVACEPLKIRCRESMEIVVRQDAHLYSNTFANRSLVPGI
ncbi:hypothetical protein Psi02_80100 [Planotetraspora silvatica]|uniref:Uncharacterized protein n=1 Tax=Planotetraspora silvatica TaxID=234614 RepID=A0A8J3UY26_9ACTN|nr:hypothetical protein Psi02_80100 [Planotetraspora silvatica]